MVSLLHCLSTVVYLFKLYRYTYQVFSTRLDDYKFDIKLSSEGLRPLVVPGNWIFV